MGTHSPARSRPRRAGLIVLVATCLAGTALVVQAPVAGASTPASSKWTPAVGFIPYPLDVFILNSMGALIAADPVSTPPSAPLFNLAGNSLNLTWGQFDSATATSLARTVRRPGAVYTDFRITLKGLIPGGVYSLFYRTFNPNSVNPICGNVGDHEQLVALTARHPRREKPDADSFVANKSGGESFYARVPGDLMAAQQVQVIVIYHFDGKTYGPVPNQAEANENCTSSFAIDAIRQLIVEQK